MHGFLTALWEWRELYIAFLASGIPTTLILGFLRHYHKLRNTLSEAMHDENKNKLEENRNKLIEVATDLGEIKRAQGHLHECLEDVKGRVASANSHEERIGRLEDALIGGRPRARRQPTGG